MKKEWNESTQKEYYLNALLEVAKKLTAKDLYFLFSLAVDAHNSNKESRKKA